MFVHLHNEDDMMVLVSQLNPKCLEFHSEPEAGFRPTFKHGSRKYFHNTAAEMIDDPPEHCKILSGGTSGIYVVRVKPKMNLT